MEPENEPDPFNCAYHLCHPIDFTNPRLTIPITTAFPAVQSNEVYPPPCRLAFLHHFRVGG